MCKNQVLALTACLIVLAQPVSNSSAATYLYDVDIVRHITFAPGFTGPTDFVGGTITTDCNNCIMSATDMVDWNLTLSVHGQPLDVLTGPLSGDNSTLRFTDLGNLVATPLGLFFDFSIPDNFVQIQFFNPITGTELSLATNQIVWNIGNAGDIIDPTTSDQIGTAVAGVPEPSTWVMMLIGFAGLGFAAHRQSRKAAGKLAAA